MPSTTTMSQEIALVGGSLAVRQSKGAVTGNWEYYPLCNIISVVAPIAQIGFADRDPLTNQKAHRYGPDDMFRVVVEFDGRIQRLFDFDLAHVTNQAGWTLDAAGLQQAVDDINQWITECCCSVAPGLPGGGALEATQQQVLTAIRQHQDFELKLVKDEGNGDKIVCERVEYDEQTDTYSYSYTDVGGAAYVPVGPIVYLDPEAVLNLLLASIDATIGTDGVAHGAGQQGQRALGTDGTNDQQLATDVDGHLQIDVLSLPAGGTNNFNLLVASGVGNIPAGAKVGSVFNIGAAAGTLAGVSIAPGVRIPIPKVDNDDTYGVIAYDGTGTQLLIQYTT